MDKRLTAEQVAQCERIIKAFVSAIIRGTDAVANEAHKVSPCPVLIWEDVHNLDNEILEPFKQYKGKQ